MRLEVASARPCRVSPCTDRGETLRKMFQAALRQFGKANSMHGPEAPRSGKIECDSLRVYRGKGEGNTQVGKYRVRGEPGEGLLRPLVARIRPGF